MLLIDAQPIETPADGERLVASMWQRCLGTAINVYILGGTGDRKVWLGVKARDPHVEKRIAQSITDLNGGDVVDGGLLEQVLLDAPEKALIHMIPEDRHLVVDSKTFGWQRTDALLLMYRFLEELPPDMHAGVLVTLRPVPGLDFAMSAAAFAVGPMALRTAADLVSTYGGVGLRPRRPVMQGRAFRRAFGARLRRPLEVKRVEIVSLFWRPPLSPTRVLEVTGV